MTNIPDTATQKSSGHPPRPLIDLLVSILIPSVTLMKFSGDNELGGCTIHGLTGLALEEIVRHEARLTRR